MNRKKILALVLCLTFSLTLLSGCGSKAATFTSTDGITITATSQWKQVTTLEDMQKLVGGLTAADMETMDLGLQKGDSPYFTIEKYDCGEDYTAFVEFIDSIKVLLAGDVPEAEFVASFQDEGYTESEIAVLQKAWQAESLNGDAGDLFYQESLNASWLADLEENAKNYAFIGQEELTLFGKTSYLLEYKYQNDDTTDIHVYEANIKLGDTFYTLSAWTGESDFAKAKEELKSLITTATMGTPAAPATDAAK